MDFEDGTIRDADQFALRSFTRGAATLHQMMFNFGKTRVEIDEADGAVLIHCEDVAAYPEATRLSSEGYSTAMSSRALGRPCEVRVERVRPDSFTLRFSS